MGRFGRGGRKARDSAVGIAEETRIWIMHKLEAFQQSADDGTIRGAAYRSSRISPIPRQQQPQIRAQPVPHARPDVQEPRRGRGPPPRRAQAQAQRHQARARGACAAGDTADHRGRHAVAQRRATARNRACAAEVLPCTGSLTPGMRTGKKTVGWPGLHACLPRVRRTLTLPSRFVAAASCILLLVLSFVVIRATS